jgi:hypothetical protein
MRPPPLFLALGAAFVFVVSACSGSDDTAAETTAPELSTTLDTGPTTSFNVPQVTAATAPAATTPPVESTAIAPTTTAPPVAGSTEEAVGAAAVAAREAYIYAVFNVGAPDALDPLRATHAADGESLQIGLTNYQQLVDNGWLVRPHPEIADTTTVEGGVVLVDDTTAELTVCTVGAAIVYAPGVDGAADVIINDEISAARDRITLVLEDSAWKLRDGQELGEWIGETSCPAE